MRKVLWCCAILALQAAATVFLVAEYAYRYPNSMVAHCVVTTYHAGTDWNPVYRLGHAAAGKTLAMVQNVKQGTSHPVASEAPATVIPADPEPVAAECPHQGESCPATGREAVPAADGGHMLGKIVIPPDPEEAISAAPLPPMGAAGEECDDAPPTMPPAADTPSAPPSRMPYADEGKEADGPSTMPHADDDAATQVPVDANLLQQFYEEEADHCTDEGATEESEPPPDATPDCREDPNRDKQYPGCPYNGGCPHSGQCPAHDHGTPSAGEEQNIPPMPEGDPDVYLQHKPKYAPRDGSNSSDYCPPPSKLDTMEFRRSDARPEDFDRFPF
jgi:hypothetical protein